MTTADPGFPENAIPFPHNIVGGCVTELDKCPPTTTAKNNQLIG